MNKFISIFGPFAGGVIFALGLGLAKMTEPQKIIGFLDLFGSWDPSLAFVMVGAIGVHGLFYFLGVKHQYLSMAAKTLHVPTNKVIDKKLLFGSALFGIGWGITGLCPGPGLVALVSGQSYASLFVVTMLFGLTLSKWVSKVVKL